MTLRPLALLALTLLACGGERQSRAGADSALLEDLVLARSEPAPLTFGDTAVGTAAPRPSPAQPAPAFRPAPRAQAPVRDPAPAPTPSRPVERATAPVPAPAPAPARARGIAAGSVVALATSADVCTSHRPGDRLVGTVSAPVVGEDGSTIPAGTRAVIEVASVAHGSDGAPPVITFRVVSLSVDDERVPVRGAVASTDTLVVRRTSAGGSDAKRVIGGAIAGAVIGQVLGSDTRSTVIGAAAGAAAGTASARRNETVEACLPAASTLRLTLAEPVVLAGR